MVNKNKLSEVVLLTKSYNLQDFKDWLHWHLDIIGFDHCHVFDNESSVDIKTVCDSYDGKVTYEFVKGWPNQYTLYNRYINNESPAWWVLPIDDDEFLYVSDKYNNKVNDFLIGSDFINKNHIRKLSIGWRNLFPIKYTEKRINEHLILNATGWSNEASEIWQYGNRPIKTFLLCDRPYIHEALSSNGHNPKSDVNAYTLNGEYISNNLQKYPTNGTEDLILYHYQFKCDNEWKWKCKNRKSPTTKKDWKNHPEKYKLLYNYKLYTDNRAVKLWNKV